MHFASWSFSAASQAASQTLGMLMWHMLIVFEMHKTILSSIDSEFTFGVSKLMPLLIVQILPSTISWETQQGMFSGSCPLPNKTNSLNLNKPRHDCKSNALVVELQRIHVCAMSTLNFLIGWLPRNLAAEFQGCTAHQMHRFSQRQEAKCTQVHWDANTQGPHPRILKQLKE